MTYELVGDKPSATVDGRVIATRINRLGGYAVIRAADDNALTIEVTASRPYDVIRGAVAHKSLGLYGESVDQTGLERPSRASPTFEGSRPRSAAERTLAGERDELRAVIDALPETPGRRPVLDCHRERCSAFFVDAQPVVTQADVESVEVALDPSMGTHYVLARLDVEGARRFEVATAALVQRRLAIIVDDVVVSAPVVMSKIAGGRFQIRPGAVAADDKTEALNLAVAFTGQLEGRWRIVAERQKR